MIEWSINLAFKNIHKRIQIKSQKEPISSFQIIERISDWEKLNFALALYCSKIDSSFNTIDISNTKFHRPRRTNRQKYMQN